MLQYFHTNKLNLTSFFTITTGTHMSVKHGHYNQLAIRFSQVFPPLYLFYPLRVSLAITLLEFA